MSIQDRGNAEHSENPPQFNCHAENRKGKKGSTLKLGLDSLQLLIQSFQLPQILFSLVESTLVHPTPTPQSHHLIMLIHNIVPMQALLVKLQLALCGICGDVAAAACFHQRRDSRFELIVLVPKAVVFGHQQLLIRFLHGGHVHFTEFLVCFQCIKRQ